jgi:hypothetical protein
MRAIGDHDPPLLKGRRVTEKGEADKEKKASLLISQRDASGFSRAEAFGNFLRGLRSVSAFFPV